MRTPTPSRPLPRHALVVALVALAVVLTGCGKGGESGDPHTYAALGDSYSSGAGITPVEYLPCARSMRNYPKLLARTLGVKVDDVTCGGAKTTDLDQQQSPDGGVNPPQLSAVGKQTTVATLGIGINDQGLAYVLSYACLPQVGTKATCDAFMQAPYSEVHKTMVAAADRVGVALGKIKAQAPDATVVLVGYPRSLPDSGYCPAKLPLPNDVADRGRQAAIDLDAEFARVAAEQKVTYLSTYQASEGHDVCSADPWVNGIADGGSDGAALHPTLAYHRAVAKMLAPLVRK